jgi:hypothetical protein
MTAPALGSSLAACIRVAVLALAGMACSWSLAQSPAFSLVSPSGPALPEGVVGLVQVTPATTPAEVARQLSSTLPGRRAVTLVGFADDLASVDTVASPPLRNRRGAITKAGASYPSPWLDNGVSRVRQRMAAWIAAYRSASGPAPDLVVVRCRVSMSSAAYLARVGPAGWSVVSAQPRFQALAAEVGVPNLRATMFSSSASRDAWDRHFERQVDTHLDGAVSAQWRAAFPQSTVCLEERYSAGGGLSTIARRNGFPAQVQQVPVSMSLQPIAGFAALVAGVSDLSSLRAAAAIVPTIAPPGSAAWRGASGSDAMTPALQREFVLHAAAGGARFAVSPAAGWATPDGRFVVSAVTEANSVLGSGPSSASAGTPAFDPARIAVSGSVRSGTAIWRISMADGVDAVRASFADGGSQHVARSAGSRGAWLTHPASRRLVAVEAASQSVASAPAFTLLSDDIGPPQNGAIVARPYLIIYQAVDPQSYQSARMDPARIVAAVGQEIAAGRGAEWGVLDFEEPFNDVMDAGPADPRFATAMASLVETIRAVKSAYPGIRWTYYNFPRVPFWNSHRDWAALGLGERTSIQDSLMAKYAPLMAELDWFMPSIYDYYEQSQFDANMAALITVSERSFKEASVEFLRRYMARPGIPSRPIIPAVSPWFIEGGRATQYRPVPTQELINDQFRPAVDSGVDGVAMWCATPWLTTLATRDGTNFPQWVRDEQARVRAQFAIDLFGGALPAGFDWTSPAGAAAVKQKLAAVVGNAVAALNRTVSASSVAASGSQPVPSPAALASAAP